MRPQLAKIRSRHSGRGTEYILGVDDGVLVALRAKARAEETKNVQN